MSTITFEHIWAEYEPVVQGIAYEYGTKFRRYGADADDFRQECIAWMLDNEDKLSLKAEDMEPDHFGKWLTKVLKNEMLDYGVDIKDSAGGQPRRGAYYYTINELKALLPSMFDPEKWHEPPQGEGGSRGKGVPSQGGNWIATLADVARAYEQLNVEDSLALRNFHQMGMTNQELADVYEISSQLMSYRHNRALKRLQANLGGPKPDPMRAESGDPWRGRRAISNAHALALTRGQYEED